MAILQWFQPPRGRPVASGGASESQGGAGARWRSAAHTAQLEDRKRPAAFGGHAGHPSVEELATPRQTQGAFRPKGLEMKIPSCRYEFTPPDGGPPIGVSGLQDYSPGQTRKVDVWRIEVSAELAAQFGVRTEFGSHDSMLAARSTILYGRLRGCSAGPPHSL